MDVPTKTIWYIDSSPGLQGAAIEAGLAAMKTARWLKRVFAPGEPVMVRQWPLASAWLHVCA